MCLFPLTVFTAIKLSLVFTFEVTSGASNDDISHKNQGTKELDDLGVFIFRNNESHKVIEISANNNLKVRDSHLALIGNLREITDLSLENTLITDLGIISISKLPKLEWLNLYKTGIGDNSLEKIAQMQSIKLLPIGKTKVTDNGMKHLSQMKKLEYLGLRGTAITDEGTSKLTKLVNLQGLNLAETRITDKTLDHLSELKAIKDLWLQKTKISDNSISIISKFRNLKYLDISDTLITSKGIKTLKGALPLCKIKDGD